MGRASFCFLQCTLAAVSLVPHAPSYHWCHWCLTFKCRRSTHCTCSSAPKWVSSFVLAAQSRGQRLASGSKILATVCLQRRRDRTRRKERVGQKLPSQTPRPYPVEELRSFSASKLQCATGKKHSTPRFFDRPRREHCCNPCHWSQAKDVRARRSRRVDPRAGPAGRGYGVRDVPVFMRRPPLRLH